MSAQQQIHIPKAFLWIGVVGGLLMVVMGARQTISSVRERRKGTMTWDWWQTSGIIMRCEYHYSSGNNKWATISYRYVVNGSPHFSEQVTVAKQKVFDDAERFVRDHPAGQQIDVHYNPQNTGEAVLTRGPDKDNSFWMMLGIVTTVASNWVPFSTGRALCQPPRVKSKITT